LEKAHMPSARRFPPPWDIEEEADETCTRAAN
jgi:hypothetical protein